MSISNQQIVEALAEKKLAEIVELISLVEEKFGVSAAAMVQAAAPAESAAAIEEQTEFDVILTGLADDQKRMAVIRALRAVLGSEVGLKEAKDMVEKAPTTLKTEISKEMAEEIRAALTEAGAVIEVK